MWLPDPFGHVRATIDIRQVIQLFGKEVSQPTPPLQGMLQLLGPVDLDRSPDKLHNDQV